MKKELEKLSELIDDLERLKRLEQDNEHWQIAYYLSESRDCLLKASSDLEGAAAMWLELEKASNK